MIKIRHSHTQDAIEIEALLDACFGKERINRTAYALRKGSSAIDAYSFVITNDGIIIGSIACSSVVLFHDDNINPIPMIMVGPIAVSPDYQGCGYGRMLVEKILDQKNADDIRPLIMIGDPEYYERYGFRAIMENDWILPGPYENRRLLLLGASNLPRQGSLSPDRSAL